MGELSIYQALRQGGLTAAGACAMMGNMYCESLLKSNIVEKRCTLGDEDYTRAVDIGTISRYQFKVDAFGYGLVQWTYPSRKEALYDYARSLNVSIGDEKMQCDFCIYELQTDYAGLYSYLCQTGDLPEATKRICAEYEQPVVNNFADRINAAQRYYNQLANESVTVPEVKPEPIVSETCNVTVRVLKQGCMGRDVFLLQCGLTDMGYKCGIPDGDFGKNTKKAVNELRKANKLEETGIADWFVWQTIFGEE